MKNKRTIYALFSLNLIDMVIGALLYAFVADFVGNVAQKGAWISSLFIVYKFCQIISAPILGALTDTIGRKPVLVFAAATTFLAQFFLFPRNLMGILGNRFSDGLTNGYYQNSKAMLMDIVPKNEIPKYLGYLESVTSLGVIIGPGLMAILLFLLRGSGLEKLSIVVGTGVFLAIVNVFVALSIVETKKFKTKKLNLGIIWQAVKKELNLVLIFQEIVKIKHSNLSLFRFTIITCLLYGAASFYPYLVIYLSQGSMNLSSEQINLVVLYSGTIGLIANTIFFKYFYEKINVIRYFFVSLICEIIVMLIFGLVSLNLIQVMVLLTLDGMTYGLLFGLIGGFVSKVTEESESGRVFGLLQGVSGVTTLISMLIFSTLSSFNIIFPFYYFALCIAGAAWLLVRQFGMRKILYTKLN